MPDFRGAASGVMECLAGLKCSNEGRFTEITPFSEPEKACSQLRRHNGSNKLMPDAGNPDNTVQSGSSEQRIGDFCKFEFIARS